MRFDVIHVISDLGQINFGVWNAALFGIEYLKAKHEVDSYLIVCQSHQRDAPKLSIPIIWAGVGYSLRRIMSGLSSFGVSQQGSIVVTHGCWLAPTRIGCGLKENGFLWIHTPHGMLEPWSLSQHRLKKTIYYHLAEKKYIKKADAIRAVSNVEKSNLSKLVNNRIEVVENGVAIPAFQSKLVATQQFLFMGRLHAKKGVVLLVRAWAQTMRDADARLIVAGPDEGELRRILPFLTGNIHYAGPVYGLEKTELLRQSHYYVLPSLSEGFATSVVEAMSYGLIPLISEGCNFPEVFNNNLGYKVEANQESISDRLMALKTVPFDSELSLRNSEFIGKNYSDPIIGEKLFRFYSSILSN